MQPLLKRGHAQQLVLMGFRADMDDLRGRVSHAQGEAESSWSRAEHLQQQLDKARSELPGAFVSMNPDVATRVMENANCKGFPRASCAMHLLLWHWRKGGFQRGHSDEITRLGSAGTARGC